MTVTADTIVRMGELAVSADPRARLVTIGLGSCIDLAVPALIDAMLAAGARRPGLQVALVGGARMFGAGSGSLDVGARNEAAVRDALTTARLRVRATATGGGKGRTVRVDVGSGQVLVRMAQRADEPIMEGADDYVVGRHRVAGRHDASQEMNR